MRFSLGAAVAALIVLVHAAPAAAVEVGQVERVDQTINGVAVDTFRWLDSRKRLRTISFKKQGSGNTGNGGYAVQMTYQYPNNAGALRTTTVAAPATNDGGFGYFVSHERYRDFSDGTQDTIAGKIFNKDDSPLGRGFPATIQTYPLQDGKVAIYKATITYPRYGTVDARPVNAGGSDSPPLPLTAASYKRYDIPVTVGWHIMAGRDFPRIRTKVDLTNVPPDRVSFDLRGPYGVLNFDNGNNGAVTKVVWADRLHFATTASPVTRNTGWTWNAGNTGGRYHALLVGNYEMGLFEPKLYANTEIRHGYADPRGSTSALFRNGAGCAYQNQLLPCDWEWPYQSLQYSLPYNAPNTPTTGKKIAWGSSAFYGTGPSLTRVWDSPTTSQEFVGYPASKVIVYDVCLVLDRTTSVGLTRTAAKLEKTTCAASLGQ